MTELEHAISHIVEKFAKDNKKYGLELVIDASNGNMKISLFKKGKQYIATDISNYPKPDRPVDFILKRGDEVIAIGLARYDSDRGGAQEDDRTGQYREVTDEFFRFADTNNLSHIKIIYVNDGPGLLLGTMWDDYAHLESLWPNRAIVVTLRMIQARVTSAWLGVA